MKTKVFAILAVVTLCGVCSVQAGDVDFYSDAIIRPGDDYDNVFVYDTPPSPLRYTCLGVVCVFFTPMTRAQ